MLRSPQYPTEAGIVISGTASKSKWLTQDKSTEVQSTYFLYLWCMTHVCPRARVHRAEDNVQEPVLSCHHLCPGLWTWVLGLGVKCRYPLSHLTGPAAAFFCSGACIFCPLIVPFEEQTLSNLMRSHLSTVSFMGCSFRVMFIFPPVLCFCFLIDLHVPFKMYRIDACAH